MSSQSPIKIRFTRDAYTKFMYFIRKCDQEVGFMAKTIFNPEHMSYDILSVYVPKQEVSGATTDLDAQDVAMLESSTVAEKGHLNGWLHSHVNMGVFWSGTDSATIREIGEQGLCVAVVGNKKGEMRGAIYFKGMDNKAFADGFYPMFPSEAFYDDVKIEVYDRVLSSQVNEWDKVLAENVKTKTYANYKRGRWDTEQGKWIDDDDYAMANHYHQSADHSKWRESQVNAGIVNDDGVVPLTRKEKKRLEKARTRAEREKEARSQMTLLGDDTPPIQSVGGGNTYSKLSQPLYTDVELFNMSFTELASELRSMKAQGFIDVTEEKEIQDQWRTCNLRIHDVKGTK